MKLEEFLRGKAAALAFSGGTDSALLLAAAVKAGCRVQPYFVHSAFQPGFELEDAKRLCEQLGVEQSSVYRKRDGALYRFTLALYGAA